MSQKLEQIKESRSEFIENLLAAFERDHPDFIEHLKECGLDEEADGIVLWRSPIRPGMTEKAVLDYISSIDNPFSSN